VKTICFREWPEAKEARFLGAQERDQKQGEDDEREASKHRSSDGLMESELCESNDFCVQAARFGMKWWLGKGHKMTNELAESANSCVGPSTRADKQRRDSLRIRKTHQG